MDADRGEDAAMGPGQLDDRGAVGGRRADGHDLHDARLAGPAQDAVPVAAQPGVVQVRVGVDQRARGRQPCRRRPSVIRRRVAPRPLAGSW